VSSHMPSLQRLAEQTIKVADLAPARQLCTVEPSWDVAHTAQWLDERRFDAAPLRQDPIARFVTVDDVSHRQGTAHDHSRPIDVPVVISESLPLLSLLDRLERQPFLFVLDDTTPITTVKAIVTRADLQQLPVSMVAFGLILTAEAAFDLLIDQTAPDTWLDQLSAGRREKLHEIFAARQKDNAEIGLLQCCNLDDRLTVAAKLGLWRHTWLPSRKAFERWTERLKRLRDTLAHGGGLLDAEPGWAGAIELLKDVRRFADQLWAAAHPQP